MPTNPPQNLFNPDFVKAQVRPLVDIAVPLLEEVRNHGLALFARCAYRPEGADENLVILFTYRHLLEMLDSVIVQIAECAPTPAALQLRSMFETLLTIEYILEDTQKVRLRALCYLYEVELQRRRFYLSLDPKTAEGKAFLKRIASDPYAKDRKEEIVPDLQDRLMEIEKILDTAEFKQITVEYKRTKKDRHRQPSWHELYDGPPNTRELADRLKHSAQYEILYREWSERMHAGDVIDRILVHNKSGPAARALRDPTELGSSVDFAVTFSLEAAHD